DGDQQGYVPGYGTGHHRQLFNSTSPRGFKRRGTPDTQKSTGAHDTSNQPATTTAPTTAPPNTSGTISIPRDTILVVELQNNLSTDVSQQGDRFQARVVEPRDYEGAMIDGRVTRVKRPGKAKGVAELQLSFDQIRL